MFLWGIAPGRSARLSSTPRARAGFRPLDIGEESFDDLPGTEASILTSGMFAGWTSRPGSGRGRAPYPIDDAAVHHVFPEGWIWVPPVRNGITSAGVAATAERLGFQEGAAALDRLLREVSERPLAEQWRAPGDPAFRWPWATPLLL